MSPLDLIPPPWNLVVKVGLPILALVGAFFAGDHHGTSAENARLTGKYAPRMQHAADVMRLSAERIAHARAQALADDLDHARDVETEQDKTTEKHAYALETQLATARALAADYARRLQGGGSDRQAIGSGGFQAGNASPAITAPGTTDPGGVPHLDADDVRICSENTVKALGWPAWWAEVSAITR